MKKKYLFILIISTLLLLSSCSYILDPIFGLSDNDSTSNKYGSKSDVPSSATELTVNAMEGSKNEYKVNTIKISEYQYYYFYAENGKTYYITWFDKYCCPSQLKDWNYSTLADIKVGGAFAGAQDKISEYVDGDHSTYSYGYASNKMTSSGYYVLKVKASCNGSYAIRVSTSLP